MFTHTLISITRGKVSIFACVFYSPICGRKPVVMISQHMTLYQMEQRQLAGFCNYGDDEFIVKNSDFIASSDILRLTCSTI